MDETGPILDRIALSAMPPRAGRSSCGCGCGGRCGCGGGSSEAAPARRRRPAAGATRARPAAVPELRAWQGWSRPVTLAEIRQAQADRRAGRPVSDPVLRQMLATGGQVYRVTRAGVDRGRPLTIGMTRRTGSIAGRVVQHHASNPATGGSGDRQVYQAIHNLPPGQVYVQAGRINVRDRHNRRIKFFENWLQLRERPLIYNPDSTSFDEATRAQAHHAFCECDGCCG